MSEIDDRSAIVAGAALRFAWFCRLWAVAALAHVVGNGPNARIMDQPSLTRMALFALGVVALVVMVVPASRWAVAALAGLVLVTAWLESPFLGSHWMLAALVSLVLLSALWRADPWARFAPGARWVLIAFYAFAAFAKLNADFFDPVVSCGRFYADQGLRAAGLPGIGADSAVASLPAVVGAVVELSVVPLLLVRRTRVVGVALAMAFHLLLSFDFDQHFYDFTAVLLALFSLFLPHDTLDRLAAWRPDERVKGLAPGVALGLVWLSVSDPGTGVAGLARWAAFVVWIPVGALVVWQSLRTAPRERSSGVGKPTVAAAAVVLVAVFVGTMPYLGIRTASAWNMYSNLFTHDGESNHYLVASSGTARDVDVVTLVATDDDALEPYVGSGLAIPTANLRHYLADHPGSTVTVLDSGVQRQVTGTEWGEEQGVLPRKLLFSRAVDLDGAVSCQTEFLPAG